MPQRIYDREIRDLRTDNSFAVREDLLHHQDHQVVYRGKQLGLERIGTQMVTQFPLDPMYLIDLGVIKQVLLSYVEKKERREM